MYIPPAFLETRTQVLHDLIRRQPLGWLVSSGPDGLAATPVPFLVYPGEGPFGTLRAHMARANGQWRDLEQAESCLVTFMGEQGYITPSWYPTKQVTGKVVPTWNYETVQAWGKPTVIPDPAWLQRQVEDLTASQEGARPRPWAVADAPAEYIAQMKAAIIGIEIPIARLEGKWKMSQNRDQPDQAGVITGLGAEGDPNRRPGLAEEVARRNPGAV
jgi:transcriptional regulator